jgi:hypothetical protein
MTRLYRYAVYKVEGGGIKAFKTAVDVDLGSFCGDFLDTSHTIVAMACMKNRMIHVRRRNDAFDFLVHLPLSNGE